VSLFFSQSRGGILSAVVGALILFPVIWRRIGSRVLAWSLAVALPILAVGFIAWIGPDAVMDQLGSYRGLEGEASFRLRVEVWQRMIENLPDFVWLGAGLGGFEESFAPIAPPGSDGRWDRAHNDYLQALWETGIVGTALLLLAIGVFAWRYWWPALRSRAHPLDLPRVGIAVALLSIAIHSVFDFNLQIGANGFLFALLAGLLVALRRAVDQYGRERPQAVVDCAPRAPVVY
jgi:O-antigen ligase